jgi:hypothetical protein
VRTLCADAIAGLIPISTNANRSNQRITILSWVRSGIIIALATTAINPDQAARVPQFFERNVGKAEYRFHCRV